MVEWLDAALSHFAKVVRRDLAGSTSSTSREPGRQEVWAVECSRS